MGRDNECLTNSEINDHTQNYPVLSPSTEVVGFTSFHLTVQLPSRQFFRTRGFFFSQTNFFDQSFNLFFPSSLWSFSPSNCFKIQRFFQKATFLSSQNVSIPSLSCCSYYSFNRYSYTQQLHYFICVLSINQFHSIHGSLSHRRKTKYNALDV